MTDVMDDVLDYFSMRNSHYLAYVNSRCQEVDCDQDEHADGCSREISTGKDAPIFPLLTSELDSEAHMGTWLREQILVETLQRRRLFRTWRKAKFLRMWRGAVSELRFRCRLADVEGRALLADCHSCRKLATVGAACAEIQTLAAFDSRPLGARHLEEWVKTQAEVVESKILPQVRCVVDKMSTRLARHLAGTDPSKPTPVGCTVSSALVAIAVNSVREFTDCLCQGRSNEVRGEAGHATQCTVSGVLCAFVHLFYSVGCVGSHGSGDNRPLIFFFSPFSRRAGEGGGDDCRCNIVSLVAGILCKRISPCARSWLCTSTWAALVFIFTSWYVPHCPSLPSSGRGGGGRRAGSSPLV
eukprot:jgi/Botrbrau1/7631/Bobra.0159s0079.1